MGVFNQLAFVRDEIKALPGVERRPRGGVGSFLDVVGQAVRLALLEKEIFAFALVQLVAVGLGYLLWVKMLDWIPDEVWYALAHSEDSSVVVNLALFGWSLVCVGFAAFPLGLFTGCMGAAHLLHRQGERSSIARCLMMVLPCSWSLWAFHWADGWVTVNQILDRLPKKRRRSAAARAISEGLYYAWKLGIAGVLPSILGGSGLVQSGVNSVRFVQDNFRDVARLRAGYSTLCWIVGVLAWVGAVFLLQAVDAVPAGTEVYQRMHAIYLWAGVPVLVAAAVVIMLLRPIYVIALCELYARHLERKGERLDLAPEPTPAASALAAFIVLGAVLWGAWLFGESLGITAALSP